MCTENKGSGVDPDRWNPLRSGRRSRVQEIGLWRRKDVRLYENKPTIYGSIAVNRRPTWSGRLTERVHSGRHDRRRGGRVGVGPKFFLDSYTEYIRVRGGGRSVGRSDGRPVREPRGAAGRRVRVDRARRTCTSSRRRRVRRDRLRHAAVVLRWTSDGWSPFVAGRRRRTAARSLMTSGEI